MVSFVASFYSSRFFLSRFCSPPPPLFFERKRKKRKTHRPLSLSLVSSLPLQQNVFPGVPFRGSRLRIRRPNNYDSAAAALLGPTDPDPSVDASRLGAVRTSVADGPDKVFVGGLPCDWDADRVKRLLAPYGRLAAFNLVMDKSTGNSKGYAFCEFADGEFGVFPPFCCRFRRSSVE